MYPKKISPRNQWYVAAHSEDVGRQLLSRWLLDEPVCLYRTSENAPPVALADRCIHRQMPPLSKGRLGDDDTIECGYHGTVYRTDGQAERIPSQPNVPPAHAACIGFRSSRNGDWCGSGWASLNLQTRQEFPAIIG